MAAKPEPRRHNYIVTFTIPESPYVPATMMVYHKASIAEVEAWVKSMFGTDITVESIIRRIDNPRSGL